jgi:hypothetical protein
MMASVEKTVDEIWEEAAAMQVGGKGGRWLVGLGALFVAILALYVLMIGKPPASSGTAARPAMDEIDAKSRAEMRDLLRKAEED